MKELHNNTIARLMAIVIVAGVAFINAGAQKTSVPAGRTDDATRRSAKAADVIKDIMGAPDKGIPTDLLRGAEAVVVCPEVLKAAFGVGGQRGQCVVSRRTGNGWSAPVFYNMSGGSFGAQIGGEKADFVMLIMNKGGLNGLLEDKFEIGGEAGVTAGPVGRKVSASTNATLDAGILSYSHSEGAFIGAALKGVAITPDNDLNEAYYGKKAKELLGGGEMQTVPAEVRVLPDALSRYSKG